VSDDRRQPPCGAAAGDRARCTRSPITRPWLGALFPAPGGGYLDLHDFRNRDWKPAQRALGIDPVRGVYDLRHTFATFALRAGISTFDLSRYMGASLTMIDRHYGHLAKDGREHTIALLDAQKRPPVTLTANTARSFALVTGTPSSSAGQSPGSPASSPCSSPCPCGVTAA
jgi:hypothetical protein